MAEPNLFNLYWLDGDIRRDFPVAVGRKNLLRELPSLPAIIVYPSLLTPCVHVRNRAGRDKVEILLLSRGIDCKEMAHHVNLKLHVTRGLAKKRSSRLPLVDSGDPASEIEVTKFQPDEDGILRTEHRAFRGILHPSWQLHQANRPKEGGPGLCWTSGLTTFYSVSIPAACLATAADHTKEGVGGEEFPELQDDLITQALNTLNGPALRQLSNKRGHYCFKVDVHGSSTNLDVVDEAAPIRAEHPVYVYPEGSLGAPSIGHATDIHINARQKVLAASDMRVIDYPAEREPPGHAPSPRLGDLIPAYDESFVTILRLLKQKGADLILLGGDFVDHSFNCYPFLKGVPTRGPGKRTALEVWDLVDLVKEENQDRSSESASYQSFVDMLLFYSIVRAFITSDLCTPLFAVAGNHDAYDDAYGIAPRALWTEDWELMRANEGIPADHNLTLHEADLIFGPTAGGIRRPLNFEPARFDWYFNVLTPFSDWSVALPSQRLTGLHWGDSERFVDLPFAEEGASALTRRSERSGSLKLARPITVPLEAALKSPLTKAAGIVAVAPALPQIVVLAAAAWAYNQILPQRVAHLPRADKAISDAQWKLFDDPEDGHHYRGRFRVLLTHFPIASFHEKFGSLTSEPGQFHETMVSEHEMGTFEVGRTHGRFQRLLDAGLGLSCSISGHSHRRGMYSPAPTDTPGVATGGTNSLQPQVSPPIQPTPSPQPTPAPHPTPSPTSNAIQMDPIVGRGGAGGKPPRGGAEPYFIVSDSGGPLPRRNDQGEFGAWGSARPSGSLIRFSMDGAVSEVHHIDAQSPKTNPRAAVALEYVQVFEDEKILDDMFLVLDYGHPFFVIAPGRASKRLGLHCESVRLYLQRPDGSWEDCISMRRSTGVGPSDRSVWAVPTGGLVPADHHVFVAADASHSGGTPPDEHLRNWAFAPRGKRFISLSFGKGGSDNPVSGRYRWSVNSYNWRDAWEFEVGTRFVGARDELPAGFAARKHGMLHLEARWLSPDLDWRQRFTL